MSILTAAKRASERKDARKILVVAWPGGVGGVERCVQRLSSLLPGLGLATQVLLCDPAPSAVDFLARNGVRFEVLSLGNGTQPLTDAIRRSGAAAVNVHFGDRYLPRALVEAARAPGVRCIASLHSGGPWDDEELGRATCDASSLVDGIIVLTGALRDQLAAGGVPLHKIHVIPGGVPAPPAALPGKAESRARLGLDPSGFVVAAVARPSPEKGIDVLLAAAAAVGDCQVVVAGEGPDQAAMEALAARLGVRARFTGHLDDVEPIYAAGDMLALSSRREGMARCLLEAAMRGLPCVTTDCSGARIAVDDRETGFVVPVGDVAALASAIALLRDEPLLRGRMGALGAERGRARFDDRLMASRYAVLLAPGVEHAPRRAVVVLDGGAEDLRRLAAAPAGAIPVAPPALFPALGRHAEAARWVPDGRSAEAETAELGRAEDARRALLALAAEAPLAEARFAAAGAAAVATTAGRRRGELAATRVVVEVAPSDAALSAPPAAACSAAQANHQAALQALRDADAVEGDVRTIQELRAAGLVLGTCRTSELQAALADMSSSSAVRLARTLRSLSPALHRALGRAGRRMLALLG